MQHNPAGKGGLNLKDASKLRIVSIKDPKTKLQVKANGVSVPYHGLSFIDQK